MGLQSDNAGAKQLKTVGFSRLPPKSSLTAQYANK